MEVRKLRSAFLRIHYSFLRLIAVVKDVLETHQEVDLSSQLLRLTAIESLLLRKYLC